MGVLVMTLAATSACGGDDSAATTSSPPTSTLAGVASTVLPPAVSTTTVSTTTAASTDVPTSVTTTITTLPATTLPATTIPPTTLAPTTTTWTTVAPATTTAITTATSVPTAPPPLGGTATACQGVALIGDSTAVGLDGTNGVLSGGATINAQLAAIGVADLRIDASGGRSIVETLPGQANGPDAIAAIQATGFAGCWVILLGTNDAANIAAGSNADAARRIGLVLDAVAGEPTLWLTASTVRNDGFWARPNTLAWNDRLLALLAGVPNVQVADWDAAASAQPWFVSDDIHPNPAGLTARARFVADNLRVYFPA
ncbi:MAG: hypothetical protein ABJH68_22220 [Ilumatobacter sp.]|uniref:hypothetical protein n=1 Tax=Ilumatobacter sp. TaxID=1967498 RepID=UPI00329A6229